MLYVKHPAGMRAQPYEKQRIASLEGARSLVEPLGVPESLMHDVHTHALLQGDLAETQQMKQ